MKSTTKFTSEPGFRPEPFTLKKDRRFGVVVDSPEIAWTKLSNEEVAAQWRHCVTALWSYDNENVLTRDDLYPTFLKFIKQYYSEEEISIIKKAPEWEVNSNLLGKVFLISTLGLPVDSIQETLDWVSKRLGDIIQKYRPVIVEDVPPVQKPSVQDHMKEHFSDLVGELQGIEDRMLTEKVDILKFLQDKNVPKIYLEKIENIFRPRLTELKSVIERDDDQLVEGYSSYRRSQVKNMVEFYERLLGDVDAYRRVKVATRKVRTVKPKSPIKLVAKVKYLPRFDELGLVSLSPTKMIGAKSVWLYNVKLRALMVYHASETEKELTVKGTTLLGWDPKSSVSKTLRKPEEQVKAFMETSGKVAVKNFMKTIKAKEKPLTGRINTDCLILKVI